MAKELRKGEYRKRVFATTDKELVTLVKVTGDSDRFNTHLVLHDDNEQQYKIRLIKKTESTEEKASLGFPVTVTTESQVKPNEIGEYVPEEIQRLIDFLKDKPAIKVNMSFSESAFFNRDDVLIIYRTLYESDVKTIYSPELYKTDDLLAQLIEKKNKYLEAKESKPVDL